MDRREFIGAAASGGAALALVAAPAGAASLLRSGPAGKRPAAARGARFLQGVACGDPSPRGISLWTRLDQIERSATVELEVARDPDFRRVVERRRVVARKGRDYTLEARLSGLKPAEQYFYRFDTGERSSEVGRFRTLPPRGSRQPVRIGVFSCQDYGPGYYTAHAGLAQEDLDLVICLGDYIYERTFYEPAVREDTLGANGDGEVQTLAEYRQKYSLYHSDPNLQAVRASFPLMAISDDHEVEDNYARDLPGEATLDPRVEFLARRRNGYRAYFEHMPFRPVRPRRRRRRGSERFRNYRRIRLGRSAELFLLDQRQYRDDQPCGDELPPVPPCPEEVRNDPSRTLLGAEQKAWLMRGLEESKATWKLIASQVMMMAVDVPAGNPVNMDQWDGYGAERREILEHVAAKEIENVAVLTGDIHTFFAGRVTPTGRQVAGSPAPVATEFVAGSMTSLGIPETVAGATGTPLPPETVAVLSDSEGFRAQNPHYAYVDTENRGYGVVGAADDALEVSFRSPQTTELPESEVSTLASFRVASGTPDVEVL